MDRQSDSRPEPDAHGIDMTECSGALAAGVRRLAMQKDVFGMAEVAEVTVRDLVSASGVRCYYHYATGALLWTHDGVELPTSEGIAGLAARTGRQAEGQIGGRSRAVAQPIAAPDGHVHAVVVLERDADRSPFSVRDLSLLALWAAHVGPLFHLLHLEEEAVEAQIRVGAAGRESVYRREALERLVSSEENFGPWFDRQPVSSRAPYVLLLVFLVAVGACLAFVQVEEVAEGPAFVVSGQRHDVLATTPGVIRQILVNPGETVAKGQALAVYETSESAALLQRSHAELEAAIEDRLRDPGSRAAEAHVARTRADRVRAATELERRTLRAPIDGRVGYVGARSGRAVSLGEVVLSVTREGEPGRMSVRAFVPGRHRPSIEVGQPLTLDLDGIAEGTQHLTISAVSDEVVGADELRRVAAPRIADAVTASGPLVLVEAELPSDTIDVNGEAWALHEGMVGHVEINVETKPLFFVLFPSMEGVVHGG